MPDSAPISDPGTAAGDPADQSDRSEDRSSVGLQAARTTDDALLRRLDLVQQQVDMLQIQAVERQKSEETTDDALLRRLDLVQQQVDALQIQAVERQKSEETTDDALLRRFDLVQQQVDVLQIQAAEREKPWYRNASITTSFVTSLLAIIVSVGTSIWVQREQGAEKRQDERLRKQETIMRLLTQVTDLRDEDARKARTSDWYSYAASSSLLGNKRALLLESAVAIADELGAAASPAILRALAWELAVDSDFANAQKLLQRALSRVARNSLERLHIARLLGYVLLATANPQRNDIAGRRHYQEATEMLASGESYVIARAMAYSEWAHSEEELGRANNALGRKREASEHTQLAAKLLKESRKAIESLPVWHAYRISMLAWLDSKEKQADALHSPFANLLAWTGEWTFTDPIDPKVQGRVIITHNSQTQALDMRLDLLREAQLLGKYWGQGLQLTANDFRFEWTGVKLGPLPGMFGRQASQQVVGHTLLRARDYRTLSAQHYTAGEEVTRWTLVRKGGR